MVVILTTQFLKILSSTLCYKLGYSLKQKKAIDRNVLIKQDEVAVNDLQQILNLPNCKQCMGNPWPKMVTNANAANFHC